MQEHSEVEQQNYYLKSDATTPSGILHQLSLTKWDPFRKKKRLLSQKKTLAVFCIDPTAIGSDDFVQIRQ